MELKNGAVALAAAALLFLALAALTGGIVLYAAFAAAALALSVDFGRFARDLYDVRRRLLVRRELSKAELLLGSALTATYYFDYGGSRPIALLCRQPGGRGLEIGQPLVSLDLRPGAQLIEFAITPNRRGRRAIPALEMAFESRLFRGAVSAGGEGEINVYPHIEARPARAASRSLHGSAIGNEAIQQGYGTDFSHLRVYAPGDSIRHIDWARTSKYGELVVKDFEDVRPMPSFLLIDVDASMGTGPQKTELESAVELAVLVAGRALADNERVGVASFSRSGVTGYLPLAGGQAQMARVRELLAALGPVPEAAVPRASRPVLQEAVVVGKAFEGDGLGAILEESVRQFTANVREDGFVRAVFRAARASNVPCHITVATNLSMGMSSLLNGVRIARYYGHDVTVALTPHVWYGSGGDGDVEQCYRRYREAVESIAYLRSRHVAVVELSASAQPEEAILASRSRRATRGVR